MIILEKNLFEENSRKHRTLKMVYQIIHQYGPITKTDLIRMTSLKPTTLVRMIDELLQDRFIEEFGYADSSGGRPPVLYRSIPDRYFLIGIDLSRTSVKVILLNLAFEKLDGVLFPMTSTSTPQKTMDQIIEVIQDLLEKHQIPKDLLLGIGIGSVGPLDRKNGIILNPNGFPGPGWINVAIVDRLQEVIPVKIMLENGANTAVLAEYQMNRGPYQNILYCISGAGLRCGVIVNGRLMEPQTGDATAFGHMIINLHGKECFCGKKGCLASYISLESIRSEWIRRQKEIEDVDRLTMDDVLKLIKRADPLIIEIILDSAYYYGVGLANMVNSLHPDLVVLSGPLIDEVPDYFESIVNTARQYIFPQGTRVVHFSKGTMRDAAAIGAAMHLFSSFFSID